MQKNKDLIEIYEQIKNIYKDLNKESEKLKKFTFSNKWTMIFTENMDVGIAFNFTGEHSIYGDYVNYEKLEEIQDYVGKPLFELIDDLLEVEGFQERVVCMAALNALSQAIGSEKCLKKRGIETTKAKEFDFITKEDVVTVVGYGGVIDRLYGKCKELHVLDMRDESSLKTLVIGEKVDYQPKDIQFHSGKDNLAILEKSDAVIMSGCTLVNGSFKELVRDAKNARIIGVFGPSGQVIPEYLLDNGVNYITSSMVVDANSLMTSLDQPFYGGVSIHKYMEFYVVNKYK